MVKTKRMDTNSYLRIEKGFDISKITGLVMQKHQPFGWMKFKDTKCGYYMLTSVAAGVGVGINDSLFSYERIFNDYTFADSTPFGVKVEE